jgi:hypothetical protein
LEVSAELSQDGSGFGIRPSTFERLRIEGEPTLFFKISKQSGYLRVCDPVQ